MTSPAIPTSADNLSSFSSNILNGSWFSNGCPKNCADNFFWYSISSAVSSIFVLGQPKFAACMNDIVVVIKMNVEMTGLP